MARARLSDQTIVGIREAQQSLVRAKKALRLAQELADVAQERYNAAVSAAGFDPETFRLYPDGTAADGPPNR